MNVRLISSTWRTGLVLVSFIHLVIHCVHCDPLIFKSSKSVANSPASSAPTAYELLSDVWSSLTQSNSAPSCPGKCVHAITAIMCETVLEEVSCGGQYMRCCTSQGTPVQTSPPLDPDNPYTTIPDQTSPPVSPHQLLIHAYPQSDHQPNTMTPHAYTPATSTSSFHLTPTPGPALIHRQTQSQVTLTDTASQDEAVDESVMHSSSPMSPNAVNPAPDSPPASRPVTHAKNPLSTATSSVSSNQQQYHRQPAAPNDSSSFSSTVSSSQDKRQSDSSKETTLASASTVIPSHATPENDVPKSYRPLHEVNASSRPDIHPECPGTCIKLQFARFCGNIMSNGRCSHSDEACCMQSEVSLKETEPLVTSRLKQGNELMIKPAALKPAIDFPNDRSKSSNASHFNNHPYHVSTTALVPLTNSTTTTTTTTTTTPEPVTLEPCPGTCFMPLFAMICEEKDESKECSNGGVCCMTREPTTTPAPPPTCEGNCIPTFFSGAFCNRPAELIPKTVDCMPGTICCAEPAKSDSGSGEDGTASDNETNGPSEDEEDETRVHPPPHINRPVPQPLQPPPHMLFNRPFPSYPIHSYPQPGLFAQVRPNRPMHMPSFGPGLRPPPQHMQQPQRFQRPQQQAPPNNLDTNKNMEPIRGQSAPAVVVSDPPPMCNGVCITPLLKFTCFGSNVLYQNFACQSPEEICCASVSEVQAYEANMLKNVIPAHFLDVKPVLHPSVISNFIATKGQALGPHLHPQAPIIGPQPAPQQPQMQPQPHPRPQSPAMPPQPPIRPNVQQSNRPNVLHPAVPTPGSNAIATQLSPQHVVAKYPSKPQPAIRHPDHPHAQQAQQQPTISSPATPPVIHRQTQNPPPTESTMSVNSSLPTSVTLVPVAAYTASNSSGMGPGFDTTLSSITNIITAATSSPTLTSTPAPGSEISSPSPTVRRTSPLACGVKGVDRPETPRVVGGRDSLPGEWCWQVALVNGQNQYLCGGALIGTQWVLTAAHCITTMVRNSEDIFIRVGDHDLQNPNSSKSAQTVKVSTTYIHHNHNGQTLDNDIALLRMETPVEVSDAVCLVCLPTRGSTRKPGKVCHVSGYGYTAEVGPMALKVRSAAVPIVGDQDCTSKINSVTEKLFILPASSFCAGGSDGNDACQGDGGGPLVCESDGFYEITGLVSWGFGCGRPDVPAVYVKVSSFIGWINQIISVNNQ